MFVYIERERPRDHACCTCEWGRGRERGRQRIPSRLCVSMEPIVGLDLMNREIVT